MWGSQKQSSGTSSITKVEYILTVSIVKEVIWIWHLWENLGLTQDGPTILHSNNQSAIRIVRNLNYHLATKHIDAQYQVIWEAQESGIVDLHYIRHTINCQRFLLRCFLLIDFLAFLCPLKVGDLRVFNPHKCKWEHRNMGFKCTCSH